MLYYSNIPNRKQVFKQNLALPQGFRTKVYAPNCCELEHENKPQKLILFNHDENNLTFAKINLYQIIYSNRQDMFIFLSDNFQDDDQGNTIAPVRASIQGVEYTGHLLLQCEEAQGGTLALLLTEAADLAPVSPAQLQQMLRPLTPVLPPISLRQVA